MGRLSLDWSPGENVQIQAWLTGARDRSDNQAPQYRGSFYNIYSASSFAVANGDPATTNPYGYVDEALYEQLTDPSSPGYRADHIANQRKVVTRMNGADPLISFNPALASASRAILGTPVVNASEAAEWTPGFLRGNRDSYWQGAVRADIDLTSDIVLTSITAYAQKKFDRRIDEDGTAARSIDVPLYGKIKAFNQELHISGNTGKLQWIVGANYDNITTSDNNDFRLYDYVGNDPLSYIDTGLGPVELGAVPSNLKMESFAVFANGEYAIADNLSVQAGLRYTKNNQKGSSCYNDLTPHQGINTIFVALSQAFGAPADFVLNPGDCFMLGDGRPGTTVGVSVIDPVKEILKEDNISFRVGLNYRLENGGLIYGLVSQGYKAGLVPHVGGSIISQLVPAKQEKVISYEAGIKMPLSYRRVQLNGSAFYYKYSDKQIRAKISDPVFGLLDRLINVPKSRIWGLEGEITSNIFDGLFISANATYINSKVTSSFNEFNGLSVYNMMGFTGDFKGSELPFTPNFMANADVQYEWSVGDIRPFIGGTFVYQGSSNATFENPVLRADFFELPSWETLDVRAGIKSEDGSWKFTLYGKNIFNKYVVTASTFYQDAYFRMVGQPTVYGASLSFRY